MSVYRRLRFADDPCGRQGDLCGLPLPTKEPLALACGSIVALVWMHSLDYELRLGLWIRLWIGKRMLRPRVSTRHNRRRNRQRTIANARCLTPTLVLYSVLCILIVNAWIDRKHWNKKREPAERKIVRIDGTARTVESHKFIVRNEWIRSIPRERVQWACSEWRGAMSRQCIMSAYKTRRAFGGCGVRVHVVRQRTNERDAISVSYDSLVWPTRELLSAAPRLPGERQQRAAPSAGRADTAWIPRAIRPPSRADHWSIRVWCGSSRGSADRN